MTTFIDKIKSLAIAMMVFSFLITVTVSSCTPKDKASEDTESVEDVAEGSEEHPTDSIASSSESEEHPTESEDGDEGEEHPTEGEEEEEHPTEENQ